MSLVMAISNCNGIVISADRRVTRDPVDGNSSLLLTDNERKLFVTKSGHAIATVGSGVLKNMKSSSCLIKEVIDEMPSGMLIGDELITIRNTLADNVFDDAYIILIGAGFDNGEQKVLSISLKSEPPVAATDALGYGLIYRGDDTELQEIFKLFPVDAAYYPIQEMVEYLKFLNRTIAGFQKYSKYLQSISEKCDVLVIRKSGVEWETTPKWL